MIDNIVRVSFSIKNNTSKNIEYMSANVIFYDNSKRFLCDQLLKINNLNSNKIGTSFITLTNIKVDKIGDFKTEINFINYSEEISNGKSEGTIEITPLKIYKRFGTDAEVDFKFANKSNYFLSFASIEIIAYSKTNEFLGTSTAQFIDIRPNNEYTQSKIFYNVPNNSIDNFKFRVELLKGTTNGEDDLDLISKISLKDEEFKVGNQTTLNQTDNQKKMSKKTNEVKELSNKNLYEIYKKYKSCQTMKFLWQQSDCYKKCEEEVGQLIKEANTFEKKQSILKQWTLMKKGK